MFNALRTVEKPTHVQFAGGRTGTNKLFLTLPFRIDIDG